MHTYNAYNLHVYANMRRFLMSPSWQCARINLCASHASAIGYTQFAALMLYHVVTTAVEYLNPL